MMRTLAVFIGSSILGIVDSQILKLTWNTEFGPLWLGLTIITTTIVITSGVKL
jgi:hypothetical protein